MLGFILQSIGYVTIAVQCVIYYGYTSKLDFVTAAVMGIMCIFAGIISSTKAHNKSANSAKAESSKQDTLENLGI